MTGSSETFGQDSRAYARLTREAQTVRRILSGALVAAARYGVDGLSMAQIAETAGVSRRTLYRYFSGRDAVLECMSEQVRARWEVVLHEAVRDEPAAPQRATVVLRSIVCMAEVAPESKLIFENAPGYALAYLRHHFPDFVDSVSRAMEPVLDTAAAVRAGLLDEREVAEIALRIGMADFLVPGDRGSTLTEKVDTFWSLVGGQVSGRRPSRMPSRAPLRAVSDLASG